MAVAPSPNSKASVSAPVEKKKRKMVGIDDEEEETMSAVKSDNPSSQPPKRNKSPGVRVVHGRIYDSQNGTTCHQCRQKTLDVSASCKNQARTKPCPLKYCRKCLLNRYGEKAEDVASLSEWNCPKCRGVCNCSICMKRRGHQPTGMLVQMAKAGGFSSVSDLIHVKGAENLGHYKSSKEIGASPRKLASLMEGIMITSPKKLGKENLFDGKTDSNANPPPLVPSLVEEKAKKTKRKRSEVIHDGSVVNDASINEKNQKKLKTGGLKETHGLMVSLEKTSDLSVKKKLKKQKVEGSKEIIGGNMNGGVNLNVNGVQNEKDIKTNIHDDDAEEKNIIHEGGEVLDIKSDQKTNHHVQAKKYLKVKKNSLNLCNNLFQPVVPLPTGSELVTIVGVDLPKEDAGNALQLLEFCATFGKILDVKKGQAEAVLRELINGRNTRRGKYSLVIQFHIQLLSIIRDESESQSESESESPTLNPTHGNNLWLKSLKSCIPKSHLLENIDCLESKAGGYDNLDSLMKLKLLNFLCDEVLGTEKVRNWIDDQNIKFAEKKKEAKDKLSAAKDKEKDLKQKMQDDIAKAIIARDGVPLTILEHDAVVSKIKKQAAQAHDEMLACKRMVPMDKERPDAVRIEPIFRDNNGNFYWKLKGFCEKSDILHQDVGSGDHTVESVDKWFEYDDEQTNVIEKHITSLRLRFKNGYKKFGHSTFCSLLA